MVWAVCKPGVAEMIANKTVEETRLGDYNGKFLKISRKTRLDIYRELVGEELGAGGWWDIQHLNHNISLIKKRHMT